MAKHKQQQALFDVLRKERGGVHAAEARPAPVVRPVAPASESAAAPLPEAKPEKPKSSLMGPMTKVVAPPAPAEDDGIRIPWALLGLGALAVVALTIIGYYVVGWLNQPQPQLPVTERNPSMDVARTGSVTPGLVQPWALPPQTHTSGTFAAVSKTGGGTTPTKGKGLPPVVTPTVTSTVPVAVGPLYRVRIIQVGRSDVSDQLQTYLDKRGVEVDRETVRGVYVLFSAAHATQLKARELAEQINKALEDFEKETGIPTSHDAYPVQVR
jgi:hypothetical protein